MNRHAAFVVLLTGVTCVAQGKLNFANRVGPNGGIVNAPVLFNGENKGPGPDYTAQLLLQGKNGSLISLVPTSTFGTDFSLPPEIRDMYWSPVIVDVPSDPGTRLTFVVRAWKTSFGSYDGAVTAGFGYSSSDPFSATVGGGTLPPGDLINLKAFSLFYFFPEPSTISIGILGAAALVLFRRRN